MVLSSWQNHCESSPGSFDECRTAPSGRRPKTKPYDLGCESVCTGCQKLHPPSPLCSLRDSNNLLVCAMLHSDICLQSSLFERWHKLRLSVCTVSVCLSVCKFYKLLQYFWNGKWIEYGRVTAGVKNFPWNEYGLGHVTLLKILISLQYFWNGWSLANGLSMAGFTADVKISPKRGVVWVTWPFQIF